MKSFVTTKTIFRVFWSHLTRYRWLTLVVFLATISANVLDLVSPLYYKRFFDVLTKTALISDQAKAGMLIHILVLILIVSGMSWFVWRISDFFNNYLEVRVTVDIQQNSFRYLSHHSYQFFSDTFAGSLVRKVNRLAQAFQNVFEIIKDNFLSLFITITGILFVVYQRSPLIAGIVFIWVLLFMSFNYFFAKWKLKFDTARAAKDSEATGALSDSISNNITVQLFNGYAHEDRLFTKVTEELFKLKTLAWNLGATSDAIQTLLMIGIQFGVMYEAILLWQRGLLTVGDFVLLQSYLIILFGQLGSFRRLIRNMYESLADAKEMVEILELPYEIKDMRGAKSLIVKKGTIEFQQVAFNYHATRSVLKDFNLSIRPKEKVALVGSSGAGKSTVTKLLMRFYELDHGKILIDGQSIARVTQESLREAVALVPQEPILFHRSLMENIRYGRRDATDKDVFEAAKKARCHEFIQQLPQGYDTLVGERGIKLSGGERQRVAIARAILKDAPILLLDEATSSLDSESEMLIQDALHELMKNKTAIAIAHRLSTIMEMDCIIVMDGGRVVDEGTHETLLQKDSIYKKLWEIQAGGFLP